MAHVGAVFTGSNLQYMQSYNTMHPEVVYSDPTWPLSLSSLCNKDGTE